MNYIDAMKQALEAYDKINETGIKPSVMRDVQLAFYNLRNAIEAAEKQEPVAYFDPQERGFYWAKPTKIECPVTLKIEPVSFYTHPAPAAPKSNALLEAADRLDAEGYAPFELAASLLRQWAKEEGK